MSSAICFNLDQSKILSSGNGLKSLDHIMVISADTYVFPNFVNPILINFLLKPPSTFFTCIRAKRQRRKTIGVCNFERTFIHKTRAFYSDLLMLCCNIKFLNSMHSVVR